MGEQSIITAIKPSATGKGRYVLYVAGKPVGTLPGKVIERLGLRIGMAYGAMTQGAVADAIQFDKALQCGIKHVSRKPLSEAELREKLQEENLERRLIDSVVTRLKELTLVNDAALCLQIIEHINAKKPAGPALIRQKLLARKIPEPTIERMLGDLAAQRDEQSGVTPTLAQAFSLAREKVKTLSDTLSIDAKRRRIAGLLARRGFDEEMIQEIIAELLPDDSHDLDGFGAIGDE